MGARSIQLAMASLLAALAAISSAPAHAQMAADHPLSEVRTVGRLLDEHPKDDLHIVLIHGIRTADRKTWDEFRLLLCAHLGDRCAKTISIRTTDRLVLQADPPRADYFGQEVWADDGPSVPNRHDAEAKWRGSQPFVDHYLVGLKDGRHLFIDEINWWPLVLAFKCQFVVPTDADLVGPDKDNIATCAADDDVHFPWLTRSHQADLMGIHPISGGAPWLNGVLKNQIMDWGISDAVLSLGTLKSWLRKTVRCAFNDIATETTSDFGGPGSSQDRTVTCDDYERSGGASPRPSGQFALISHSLGAFLLMDTFAAAAADSHEYPQLGADQCRVSVGPDALPKADDTGEFAAEISRGSQSLCLVLAESGQLYFLANQFPLLELARTQFYRSSDHRSSFESALKLWAHIGSAVSEQKQIVAFSDPGDILTFKVPPIDGAKVINAYPHNAFRWFGIMEWPPSAHVNYLTKKEVLSVVFGG